MCAVFGHNADALTLLVNIHADINVFTGEIQFAKVNYGKSPFGSNFVGLTKLCLKLGLATLIIRSELLGVSILRNTESFKLNYSVYTRKIPHQYC